MSKEVFDAKYAGLNKEQRMAVNTIEGPVMVVAGPGTGKTTILTLRIAQILQKTDTSPEAILALTFTESGVIAMRRKLRDIIGHTAYRVPIFTFHSFAHFVIQRYPEYFDDIVGSTALGDHEPVTIIDTILEDYSGKHIVPTGKPTFYTPHIIRTISTLKQAALTPDGYRTFLNEEKKVIESSDDFTHTKGKYKGKVKAKYATLLKRLERSYELADVYEAYQKTLRERHKYDFDDMLLYVLHVLQENKEFVQVLQEEYLYVLADEHQDTNTAQNLLLETIASFFDNPNLFVVGDDKQAIYRFQGASTENFAHLPKRFEGVETIALTQNYRSPQEILDTGHILIQENPETISNEQLVAQSKNKESVVVVQAKSAYDELSHLVNRIKENIDDGVAAEEIVVLYRNNADAKSIHEALRNKKISHVIHSRSNVLEHPLMWRLITLIKASVDLSNNELLGQVLLLDILNVDTIVASKAIRKAKERRCVLIECLNKDIQSKLRGWHELFHNENPVEAIETLITEANIVDYILKTDPVDGLKVLDTLITFTKTLVAEDHSARGIALLSQLETLEKHNVRLTMSGRDVEKGKVNLMTTHQAKGLEFEQVYITGVTEKRWGKKSNRTYFIAPPTNASGEIEDERRLFYVALTRAKKQVVISYALHDENNDEQLRSQFIDELGEQVQHTIASESDPATAFRKTREAVSVDTNYLQSLFVQEGLSVTALNNYLACPWKYFFQNLLRIPHVPEPHQLYGTAMHAALRHGQDVYREKGSIDTDAIVIRFKDVLHSLPIGSNDLKRYVKRGEEALRIYLKDPKWIKESDTEVAINDVLFKVDDIEIPLKGMLDKIEHIDEKIRVVDYKTGKPKTRNYILGETKDSNGDLFRQLVFYKLLLAHHKNGMTMKEAVLDFVEPNDGGTCITESFEIVDADMETLITELQQVVRGIYSFTFLDTRCDDRECQFCTMADALPKKKTA